MTDTTNNLDGLNLSVIAGLMAAELMWEEEKEMLAKDGHLLGDDLDLKAMQTGFMLGVVRTLEVTREALATENPATR